METSAAEIIFTLSGLNETTTFKKVYFSLSLLVYLLTFCVNLTLIMTIFIEKSLHEPMYIFLSSLCLNGIYGATGFYPRFVTDVISNSHVSSYSACITQSFVLYNYVFCEFFNLTVMTYDRYNAICRPLEYHSIMTPVKVGNLLMITWLFPFCEATIGIVMTARLPLCGSVIDKLYCTNWEVVKLSCTDTTLNNIYGYILLFLHIFQFFLIIMSYIHIVKTCLRSQTERNKFMETCLPHLITLINFVLSVGFDAMYSRYGSNMVHTFRNFLTVEYLVVPPLLNPVIYGLKLKQIRKIMGKMCNTKAGALK